MTSEIEAVPSIQARIDIVAEDYHSGEFRYSEIDAWKLAELLGLDFQDNADWQRTFWGLKRDMAYDFCFHPYADNLNYLEDHVSTDRFLELSEIAEEIENGDRDEDLPLTKEEIQLLEEAYSEEPPEFSALQHVTTTVYATNKNPLHFSAIVGDGGEVEDPMSPYDLGDDPEFDPGDDYIEM